MRLFTLAVAGALLWAGAGQAWAEDCGRRARYDGYQPAGLTIVYQSGPGAYRSHGRGHHGHGWGGRGWGGRGWYSWHGPTRRYVQVVTPACPSAQAAPACGTPGYGGSAYGDTLVVNVRNDNGSYTPVTLRREGGTYIGPRGERYLSVPTEEQLKAVYGLE